MLLIELKRKSGENPGRARRCDRGRTLHECHCLLYAVVVLYNEWEDATSRTNRESEDLSENWYS